MAEPADRYEAFYAAKLWALLPALYRAEDSATLEDRGPLRELVERIAVQAAVLRRSIDRLWADQSIETCDDWVISYIGDLLATNLVASLDARGQRLDVAKTIYYRRRKGTLALLEELTADVTGWGAKVVEMFRRLGRTRHLLDPCFGEPAVSPDPDGARALLRAEQLVGLRTATPAGGLADLRGVFGGSRSATAFDEYAHTADLRRGRGAVGWHGIARLGVFLWRLKSFGVQLATPVQDGSCPNQYTFDPTGREAPLFAVASRVLGDGWTSPAEHQLPGPIDALLFDEARGRLYASLDEHGALLPGSLAIYRDGLLVPAEQVTADQRNSAEYLIDPQRGRLLLRGGAASPLPGQLLLSYHYGFSSTIGAGPDDRRLRDVATPAEPYPHRPVQGGGDTLDTELAAIGENATVSIEDSLTYHKVRNIASIQQLTVRAANRCRPLVRLPAASGSPLASWEFTGSGDEARLVLDGLLVSGGEIVLAGIFGEVLLRCCTLDPGEWRSDGTGWVAATDGQLLRPARLRVRGHVRRLAIDRSILGPIIEADPQGNVEGGRIESLELGDCIIQAPGDQLAIKLLRGEATLVRCTVLGRSSFHRLRASSSILHGQAEVEDAQHGCVRFSAVRKGSKIPHHYESVELPPNAPLFASRRFGQPGYAQLRPCVAPAVASGADDGSEMGAFCREKNPIKQRSLQIKLREYMPAGLEPVFVQVT